jgi:hypothetical protein
MSEPSDTEALAAFRKVYGYTNKAIIHIANCRECDAVGYDHHNCAELDAMADVYLRWP